VKRHPAVVVDQTAVARNSRSNPLTYTGIFDAVRKGFAKATGRPAALFSFNSEGACPECKGQGTIKLEMSFMDDIALCCPECEGRRYTPEVLDLHWNGRNINDVLLMTAQEALGFFEDPAIRARLALLDQVGLGYLELGQSLSTLSGGESQRLKLAEELGKRGEVYVMDEPTTGLHPSDIARLMGIVEELVGAGNSVIIIEHNLEVIRRADWVIDLGPEGGERGGRILAQGTPEEIARCEASLTGRFLRLPRAESAEVSDA
jgi:excinuclease ABC A subunit